MVELKGSLDSVGLPAIVQLVGELRHSGRLELSNAASRGWLGFDAGRLVAASLGDRQGLSAVAACLKTFQHGEFLFVDDAAVGEHTLDLGPDDLGAKLSHVLDQPLTDDWDHVELPAAEPAVADAIAASPPGTCPRLGFADDPTRHYSRPTALHRCFATTSPSTITSHEQRELCLGGGYPACSRFLAAVAVAPGTLPVVPAQPVQRPVPRVARSSNVPAPPPAPAGPGAPRRLKSTEDAVELDPSEAAESSQPGKLSRTSGSPVPPGVAARLSAANQMGLSSSMVEPTPASWIGSDASALPPPPTRLSRLPRASRRALISGAALLALIAITTAAVLALMRYANADVAAQNPPRIAVAGAQASPSAATQPVRAATPVRPVIAQPTVLTSGSTAPAAARPPVPPAASAAPTSVPALVPALVPSVAPAAAPVAGPAASAAVPQPSQQPLSAPASTGPGRSLMDVRFAAAPAANWPELPPFATWSAGAYRLQARQATRFVAVAAPLAEALGDVVVTATFRKTGGPPGGGYGLIVRDQGPAPRDGVNQNMNAYVMETGDLGEFGIWRRDGDHWVDLVPWKRSTIIRPGGSPNDLAVRAVGDQLTFTVNGVDVASVQDATFTQGGVGVFVGGDNNEVALDHFAVQVPD